MAFIALAVDEPFGEASDNGSPSTTARREDKEKLSTDVTDISVDATQRFRALMIIQVGAFALVAGS